MSYCYDCGMTDAHHPNCPSYDEKDFSNEDEYTTERQDEE